ncbi:MAG: ATP-binding protein [Verrucomicrobia bacterium]|nr:ATP-binding protein [Verrucomicrobiota bacterium]
MAVSQPLPTPEASVEIELAPPRLHGLRQLAERWALHTGFNDADTGRLLAGLDEALANIHLHAYGGRPGPVRIEIRQTGQELIFELFDQGKAFAPERMVSRLPGEIGQGGWGMLMMQAGFHRIERRRAGDKNILLLARTLPGKKGG